MAEQGLPTHHRKEKYLSCAFKIYLSCSSLTQMAEWLSPATLLPGWGRGTGAPPVPPTGPAVVPGSRCTDKCDQQQQDAAGKGGETHGEHGACLGHGQEPWGWGRHCLWPYPGDSPMSPGNRRSQRTNPPPACRVDWDSCLCALLLPSSAKQLPWVTFESKRGNKAPSTQ